VSSQQRADNQQINMLHQSQVHNCYNVCIPDFNDGSELYIMKRNFKVCIAPAIPFADETPHVCPTPVPGDAVNPDWLADCNETANIGGNFSSLREKIEE
jgi:hypothetical protein